MINKNLKVKINRKQRKEFFENYKIALLDYI